MADAGVGETKAATDVAEGAKGASEAAAGAEAGTAALTSADIAAGAAGLSDAAVATDLAGTTLLPSTEAAFAGSTALSAADIAAGAGGLSDAQVASDLAGTTLSPSTEAAFGGGIPGAGGITEAGGMQTLTVTGTPPASAATPSLSDFAPALAGLPIGGAPTVPGVTDPGISVPGGGGGGAGGAGDAGPFQVPDAPIGTQATDLTGDDSNFWEWLKQPKNALTATSLGLTARNALFPPGLPGAAKTALGAAGPAVQNATMILQTGGMGSPLWATQKASIDSMIDQEIKNQTAAMQQTMVNAGMGGTNSGIVQEQIATLTQNLNVQRQELYRQALQQNVQMAVAELSGADSVLMAIAQMQLNQSNEAMQLALSGAGLAARLQQLQGP